MYVFNNQQILIEFSNKSGINSEIFKSGSFHIHSHACLPAAWAFCDTLDFGFRSSPPAWAAGEVGSSQAHAMFRLLCARIAARQTKVHSAFRAVECK